jgi:hypothetical protein
MKKTSILVLGLIFSLTAYAQISGQVIITKNEAAVMGLHKIGHFKIATVDSPPKKAYENSEALEQRIHKELIQKHSADGTEYIFIEKQKYRWTPLKSKLILGYSTYKKSPRGTWKDVQIIRLKDLNPDEMSFVSEIDSKQSRWFSSMEDLKTKSLNELKIKAFELGGKYIVLNEEYEAYNLIINTSYRKGMVYR